MKKLPIPSFFEPEKVGKLWRVPYEERATQAKKWVEKYNLLPVILNVRLFLYRKNTFTSEKAKKSNLCSKTPIHISKKWTLSVIF